MNDRAFIDEEKNMNMVPVGYKLTEVGVIPEDWEDVNLGEIAEIRMCKRILAEQTNLSGDIPFFKTGTFGRTPDAFISGNLYHEYKRKYSFPKKEISWPKFKSQGKNAPPRLTSTAT
jgi:restriction endonuclease S subunit